MNKTTPKLVRATLLRDVAGMYTTWKKGTVVKARRVSFKTFMIERVKWKQPKVPLCNQLFGVSEDCIKLHGAKK